MKEKPNILYKLTNIDQNFLNEKNEKKTILKIDSLEISTGKFTAVIGNSGSGKTTLLELLGAINKPVSGTIIFKPETENSLDFTKLWNNPELHTQFLQNQVAFAFQQANLVSYYDINENIVLSRVISSHKSFSQILQTDEHQAILQSLNITEIQNKIIETISGGQQQRVALARAAASHFKVLLADEPTGNVGEKNEKAIFDFLKKQVDEQKSSVIVVTHNIHKALEYADEIVIIEHKDYFGEINQHNKISININELGKRICKVITNSKIVEYPIMIQVSATNKTENSLEIVNPKLINFISEKLSRSGKENIPKYKNNLQSLEKTSKNDKEIQKNINIQNNDKNYAENRNIFNKLVNYLTFYLLLPWQIKFYSQNDRSFVESYLRKDMKHYYRNKLFSFFVIIFLGLFAVSLFNAWEKILYEKMNNPFVNVLLVKNDSGKTLSNIKNILLTEEFRKSFAIAQITSTQQVSLKFIDKDNEDEYSYISGRSLENNDPIFTQLISLQGNTIPKKNEMGLYITDKLLNKFGYDVSDKYIILSIGDRKRLIPILGVFKFLPGDTFIISNNFYHILQSGGFFIEKTDKISLVSFNPESLIEQKLLIESELDHFSNDISSLYFTNDMLKLNFFSEHSEEYFHNIVDSISVALNIDLRIYVEPNINLEESSYVINETSWFFIHLKRVKRSEELKSRLLELGLKIDLEKISTQKDFQIISNLLQTSILILTIITFIATLIYIRYSFYLHIYQQRRQIGIIKSLGISPKTFSKIFKTELISFLFSIYTITFISLIILQFLNYFLMHLNIVDELYLQLFNWRTLFQFLLIISSSLISLHSVLKKIVTKSSGDLIYDRNLDDI